MRKRSLELGLSSHLYFPTKNRRLFFSKNVGCRFIRIIVNRDTLLGGGFKYLFYFHPEIWGRWTHFWRAYLFKGGLVQPPTRLVFAVPNCHVLPKNWVMLYYLLALDRPQPPAATHWDGDGERERYIFIYTLGFQPPLKQWVEQYNHHCWTLRVLIIEMGSTIISMVVEAQGICYILGQL